jgi:hypothetical protein
VTVNVNYPIVNSPCPSASGHYPCDFGEMVHRPSFIAEESRYLAVQLLVRVGGYVSALVHSHARCVNGWSSELPWQERGGRYVARWEAIIGDCPCDVSARIQIRYHVVALNEFHGAIPASRIFFLGHSINGFSREEGHASLEQPLAGGGDECLESRSEANSQKGR